MMSPVNLRLWMLCLGLGLGGLWVAPPVQAACLGRVSVKAAGGMGAPGAMAGWRRWLNAALVVAGTEAGPSLPDGRCRVAALSGVFGGAVQNWRFSGALSGGAARRLVHRGRGWADWYSASRVWFGLDKLGVSVPSEEEITAWTTLGSTGAARPLEARLALSQAVQRGASEAAQLELALALQNQNPDFATARALLERLRQSRPKSYGVGLALGVLCSLTGDNPCVKNALLPVVDLKPQVVEGWAYLFAAAQDQNDTAAMARFAQRAAQANPQSAYYHYQAAVALTRLGKLKEAAAPLKQAVRLDKAFRAQALTDPALKPLRASPWWKGVGM